MIANKVSNQLDIIEAELKRLSLWQVEEVTAEQLASTQPFCMDTMKFEQWLQFVLLVRFRQLIHSNQQLPRSFAIFPMAEESFKQLARPHHVKLMNAIRSLDRLLA